MRLLVYLWFAILGLLFLVISWIYPEFGQERSVSKEWTRVEFRTKKSFEKQIAIQPSRVSVFTIPEFQQELLPFFDPAALIESAKRRSQYDSGLNVMGMNIRTHKFLFVENFPFLSFYQWCWNQRSQSSPHLHVYHWMSFRNQSFLSDSSGSSVDYLGLMRATMDKLFAPSTFSFSSIRSYHDMILLSHRASTKSLPYFMHFMTRRVLTSAFGSVRVSFLPWKDARRYVSAEDCVLGTTSNMASPGYEWLLSPKCNLRGMVRFASFTLHQGQSVCIPPYVVYHIEHILPSSKREKFEQCCVILQCDYQTSANQFKNMISFQELNRDHSSEGKGSSDLEQMKNERELQQHVVSEAYQPQTTFLRPQMNRPMKEEKEEMESRRVETEIGKEAEAEEEIVRERESKDVSPPSSASKWSVIAEVVSTEPSPASYQMEPSSVFSNAMSADDFLASQYSPVSELLPNYETTTHLTSVIKL